VSTLPPFSTLRSYVHPVTLYTLKAPPHCNQSYLSQRVQLGRKTTNAARPLNCNVYDTRTYDGAGVGVTQSTGTGSLTRGGREHVDGSGFGAVWG
jgi:hypothetical protein